LIETAKYDGPYMAGPTTPLQALEDELVHRSHDVLVVTGAGVTCATDSSPYASWRGLLEHGVEFCRAWCGELEQRWFDMMRMLIEESKAQSFVYAASRIREELNKTHAGKFGQWLNDSIGRLRVCNPRVINALKTWGVRLATLNYDCLIETVTGLLPITWSQRDMAFRMLRGELPGVLHLHGLFSQHETVVFDATSYETILRDEATQNLLRAYFTTDTVVFVGCGTTVDDPNFRGLFDFFRVALRTSPKPHFHLARDCEKVSLDRQYQGLPISVISYGDSYEGLGPFLEDIARRVEVRRRPASIVDTLRRFHVDYQSGNNELKRLQGELTATEYVRQTFELAHRLWEAGGCRTAALAMSAAATNPGLNLPSGEGIPYALEAIDRLLLVGHDVSAANLLERLSGVLDREPASEATQGRYRLLVARVVTNRANLTEAIRAIDSAMQIASPDTRFLLEAERAELCLLDGDLDGAAPALAPGEQT
jgi:hypothetical protein